MKRSTVLSMLAALGLTLGAACSSTTYYGPLPSDGGATKPDDNGGDAGSEEETESSSDAAATKKDASSSTKVEGCKRDTTGALVRVDTNPTGNLPDSTGGTLADGHYVLTQAIVMSDGEYPKLAGDLWLGGGRYEWQTKNSDGWHYSYGGTVKTSGTNLVMTVDCGGQTDAPTWSYSASGSKLTVTFTTINGFPWVYVLTRQTS